MHDVIGLVISLTVAVVASKMMRAQGGPPNIFSKAPATQNASQKSLGTK